MDTLVGAYGRISEDVEATGLGVARQLDDGESIAKVRGWTIAERYVDNDLSAFKRKVVRPEFEQMLLDLNAGKITGIVCYDLDRLVRQPRDLERLIEVYEERGDLVFASVQGDINLQSADGITMARVMVAFANKSSMDTARRVARKHLENARTGKPVGGYRPFGWKADKATLDYEESTLVRTAIADVLAGASLRSVCRDWNDLGVRTTAGREWKLPTLRQYLRSPRLVGRRTHQGEVLLDEQGKPVAGLWEPMVDSDTYDRLQLVLARPEGRARVPRRNARHYLLTGIIRCGICQRPMYGNRYGEVKGEERFYYTCNSESSENRHNMSISGHGTDALVTKLVLARLAEEELDEGPKPVWSGESDLLDTQRQVDELMAAFMAKELSGTVVFPRVQVLEERLAEMHESRTQWLRATTGPASRPVSQAEWDGLSVDLRRGHVENVLEAVLIRPATQRQNRLDPERVVPVPRQPAAR